MPGTSAKEWALELARRGLPVFPLMPESKDPYCITHKDPSKICAPADRWLAGGIHRATTDAEQIERWFEARPTINYGVSTAELVVLDADAANGKHGKETLRSFGKLAPTFTVATARDGLHIYHKGPACGQQDLGPGVNIRSTGGYVVGPGCVFEGRPYRTILDLPLADVPPPVRAALRPPGERNTLPSVIDAETEADVENAAVWLQMEPGAPEGERGSTAYRLAGRLKDFGISQDTAIELMDEHWAPRCDPPAEAEHFHAEVAHAYYYGRNVPGCDAVSAEFDALPVELCSNVVSIESHPDYKHTSNFKYLTVLGGPTSIPPRPWIVPGLLLQGSLTGLVAPPAAGKSTFVLALAIGMALGRLDFLGLEVRGEPRKTVLVNNEDDEDELRRRMYAICISNGLDWSKLHEQLVIHCPDDGSGFLAMGRHPETRKLAVTKRFQEFEAVLERENADIFIFDPFVEMSDALENDNTEVAAVMKRFRATARYKRRAGLIVHHTRKPPQASTDSFAGDPHSARGGSAFHGNVRALATLYSMSPKDADTYGVKQSQRGEYSRLDMGKGSYSPPGAHTKWFRTISYDLGQGDTAPAIEHIALQKQEDEIRTSLHTLLWEEVMRLGGTMLTRDAVKFVKENDVVRGRGSQNALLGVLIENFELESVVEGTSLVVEGHGAGRVLRGWSSS